MIWLGLPGGAEGGDAADGRLDELAAEQKRMADYLRTLYVSEFDPAAFDWETFFSFARTGELFSTKFSKDGGEGEFLNDSAGKVCVPSTDKIKGRDDFERYNAFRYVLCNFTVNDDGVKIPTAMEGQNSFARTGKVDVGVLTPPLYWAEETLEDGYVKHFSDSEHPAARPDLTLTLMPHCRDNKGNAMPYGIVPVYYAGRIEGVLYGSSGLAPEGKMSYQTVHEEMQKKGKGWQGAGSERSAYLKNFLWIKYGTLNSRKYFLGCTSNDAALLNKATNHDGSCITISKGQSRESFAAAPRPNIWWQVKTFRYPLSSPDEIPFYEGCAVSIGTSSDTQWSAGEALRGGFPGRPSVTRSEVTKILADRVRVTGIEDAGGADKNWCCIHTDAKGFEANTWNTYILSMPLYSGQTDSVLGNDGYIANDGRHSFRIQGVEEGIGAYFVSANEIMDKETPGRTVFYSRNWGSYTTLLSDFRSKWKKVGQYERGSDVSDLWIRSETIDLETGAAAVKRSGTGNEDGTGDRYYFGAGLTGAFEHISRGNLAAGNYGGLSCINCGYSITRNYPLWCGSCCAS